jgi:hypothetical protein
MIQSLAIRQHNEKYAPPEKVLRLGLVGDTLFMSIDKYDESHDTETSTAQAAIGVDLQTLLDALWVLQRADARPSRAEG